MLVVDIECLLERTMKYGKLSRQKHLWYSGSNISFVFWTGVRDYLHVVDLAVGHIAALEKVEKMNGCMVSLVDTFFYNSFCYQNPSSLVLIIV